MLAEKLSSLILLIVHELHITRFSSIVWEFAMKIFKRLAGIAVVTVLAMVLFAQHSYSGTECADANGDGRLTVLDMVYLNSYLLKGSSAPLSEAERIDGYAGVTINDIQFIYNWVFDGGPTPTCPAVLESILPVTDDTLYIRNAPVLAGETKHRIDLWFVPSTQICALSYGFIYSSDLASVTLDSISINGSVFDLNKYGYVLTKDIPSHKGNVTVWRIDTSAVSAGNGYLARLYFSHDAAPSTGRHVWIDSTSNSMPWLNPNPIVFSKDGYLPVLPKIMEISSYGSCGDINGDGGTNLLDITSGIRYLYKDGCSLQPLSVIDVNQDGAFNVLDLTYLINYLYNSGPAPNCI